MKTYNFERFDGKKVRTTPPSISIIHLKNSSILRLSRGFCIQENISKFNYVFLFFSTQKNAIGIKFLEDEKDKSLKLTNDRGGRSISVAGFLNANKLDVSKYIGKYKFHKEIIKDIGELYIIDLK